MTAASCRSSPVLSTPGSIPAPTARRSMRCSMSASAPTTSTASPPKWGQEKWGQSRLSAPVITWQSFVWKVDSDPTFLSPVGKFLPQLPFEDYSARVARGRISRGGRRNPRREPFWHKEKPNEHARNHVGHGRHRDG